MPKLGDQVTSPVLAATATEDAAGDPPLADVSTFEADEHLRVDTVEAEDARAADLPGPGVIP